MQKRARAVETQKLRRTFKARSRVSDHDGMSSGLAYLRLCLLWFTMISLDVLVGFRVELLWPFILILRAAYDSMARSTSSFVALGNQNSAQISILFVCVTATSDLICWLFIPVRFLIFLASTYVWLNLVWHTNGGFIRTVSTILSDRSQGIPIVLLWIVFIAVEIFVRLRCDYLVFAKDSPLAAVLNTPSSQFGCENVRGLSPGLARMLNEFFGAHCIGYPLVIVSFSLRYYFREWRLRRKQGDVSKQNEVLYKVLTEALPAVYEGPKQYQARLEQDTIEYELTSDVPMLMPAAPSSNGLANGTSLAPAAPASRKPSLRQSQTSQAPANRRERKRAAKLADNAQRTPPERTRQQENQDGQASRGTAGAATAGGSSCWEENGPARGLWSSAWSTLQWVATKLSEPVNDAEDASSYNDEDDDDDDSSLGDDVESNKKRNGRVAAESKQRNVQSQSSSGSGKKKPQSKVVAVQRQQAEERLRANGSSSSAGGCAPISTTSGSVLEVAPMPQMSNGHAKREDSVDKRQRAESKDKGVQENNNHAQGCEVELSRVRTEIHAAKALEADLRLQLSVAQNGESRAKQEVTQLRSRLEQLQARFGTVEKTREQEKSQTGQLERKYAELMNRKNDVERELLAERRMRAEDAAKKHKTSAETSNEQRERELRLEAEGERLRTECAAKEDALLVMQQELYQLRDYREKHDVDALQMELSILREKNAHLDATLASENKLKQDLFRALGEAKENNKELSAQLDQLRASAPSPAPPVPTPSRPSPPLHEKTHSTLPMPPPSYETCLPNNFMPYSFVSSPAPSPTGEHTLFEAHPLSGCGSRGAGPVDFALTLGHFDKFMASNAPGKPGSTRTS